MAFIMRGIAETTYFPAPVEDNLVRYRLTLLLVFVLAIAAHIDSLTYWFTTTDTLPLIATSRVSTASDLVGLFTHPLMYGSDFVHIALFYRPIASLTYALDYALWGLSSVGYQLTNLVLHGAVAVLAAVAITEITDRPTAGLLGAVLFVLHPLTVEVVPTAARRQDVLMSVFFLAAVALFIRSRKRNSLRLLGVSLVAYALALGSKETAILLPALVFVWVGIQRREAPPIAAIREAVEAVVPFAVVSVGYLVVRVAVLGGLGGYEMDNPLTLTEATFVPVKYVLWMTHPVNVVEVVVTSVSPGLILPALGLVALVVVPFGANRFERAVSIEAISFLLFVGGLVSIPLLLSFSSAVGATLPFEDPEAVISYLVGLVFVGSCVAGALAASAASGSRIGAAVWEPLSFFGIWLVLPIGLFMMSDNLTLRPYELGYSSHNSYLFIVPAMAIPALLAVVAADEVDWPSAGAELDANMALVAVVVLFLLPVVAASPLVHPYDGWHVSGDVNQQTLEGVAAELEDEPGGTTVVVEGLPDTVRDDRQAYPQAQSISPMRKHTVDAWLQLRYPDRDYRVVIDHTNPIPREPHTITVERAASEDDTVRLRVSPSRTAPADHATEDDLALRWDRVTGALAPRGIR